MNVTNSGLRWGTLAAESAYPTVLTPTIRAKSSNIRLVTPRRDHSCHREDCFDEVRRGTTAISFDYESLRRRDDYWHIDCAEADEVILVDRRIAPGPWED